MPHILPAAAAALALILTPADRDYLITAISSRTADLPLSERVEICTAVLNLLDDPSAPSTAAGVLDSVLDKSQSPPAPTEEDLRLTAAALNQALAKHELEEGSTAADSSVTQ